MHKLCRICTVEINNKYLLMPLFKRFSRSSTIPISYLNPHFTKVFTIKLNDGLPQSICKDCLNRFIFFNKFIKECETGQKTLATKFGVNYQNSDNLDLSNSQGNDCDYSTFEESMMEVLQDDQNTENQNQAFDSISNNPINLYCDNEEIDISSETDSVSSLTAQLMICKICKTELNIDKMHEHLVENHKPIILKKCAECLEIVENIDQHARKEHSVKIYCTDCDKTFFDVREYLLHRYKFHKKPKHMCGICNKGFVFEHYRRAHKLRMHKIIGDIICNICNKRFMTLAFFNAHNKIHKTARYIKSVDSGASTSTADDVETCPICPLTFDNIHDLQLHLREHRDERYIKEYQHICEFCNQRFKESYNMGLHIDMVHLRFQCQICNKRFLNKQLLLQHIRQYHACTRFSCKLCNKSYSLATNLQRHIKMLHCNYEQKY